MKERPILFKGEMVRAILEGRKTQTRRIMKPDAIKQILAAKGKDYVTLSCPQGCIGEHLWVRETFAELNGEKRVAYRADASDIASEKITWKPSIFMPRWASRIQLEITNVRVERLQEISSSDAVDEGIWGMPTDDSQGSGIIEWCDYSVRPEDNEGHDYFLDARESFKSLWDSINANRKDKDGNRLPYAWADNPWLWVVEFKRIKPV